MIALIAALTPLTRHAAGEPLRAMRHSASARSASGGPPPKAPVVTASSATSFSAVQTWDNDVNIIPTTFNVYVWNDRNGWQGRASLPYTANSYTVRYLQPSTTYIFVVCAVDQNGTTCASPCATATTLSIADSPPAEPTQMVATGETGSSISMSWTDNSVNESTFAVYRWTGSSWLQVGSVGANVTTFTDTGLQPAEQYIYVVCAQNSNGSSCAANYLTIGTAANQRPRIS